MNRYAATFWEEAGDPAFSYVVVSGKRFRLKMLAWIYGKRNFRDHFAGVRQVEWKDEELPF